MIRKILVGAILWTLLISLMHVQLNVGWAKLVRDVRGQLGEVREELVVGFLPVT